MEQVDSRQFFNENHLKEVFYGKLAHKKGGGRDHLTPQTFWKRYSAELPVICRKCVDGTYRFSLYSEKLVLKGKGKKPRVLSIPTMRDRLVLGVLNEYLQHVFPEAVIHEVPNNYIVSVGNYLSANHQKTFYQKADFHNFYGSVIHSRLKSMLEEKILDRNIIQLVMRAVKTATYSGLHVSRLRLGNRRGLPQGLPISNILASVYVLRLDTYFSKSVPFYKRYVDDILILSDKKLDRFKDIMEEKIKSERLNLRLSKEKTMHGIVGNEPVDFIGYVIKDKHRISIRQKNIQHFLDVIAKLANRIKNQRDYPHARPTFIQDNKVFDGYYLEILNERIAGFRSGNHLYGWLAYFQALTDIQMLYAMDYVIHHKLLSGLPDNFRQGVLHLPKVYWDIKKHSGKNTVTDFDSMATVDKMRVFLVKRGQLNKQKQYEDEEIRRNFELYVESLKREVSANIGNIS